MKVDFTLKRFPVNGVVKDAAGLPFSAVLQPFSKLSEAQAGAADTGVSSDAIARCSGCYSYLNCYCSFDTAGWECSLCARHNPLRPQQLKRYQLNATALQLLPEVQQTVYEAMASDPVLVSMDDTEAVSGPGPVLVALVDASGGEEFLELVRSSLEAALEGVPPCARFLLVSFSNRLGLYDVRAAEPCVRYVPLTDRGASVPLGDVLPLASALAPVGLFKASITKALEQQLLPDGHSREGAQAPTQPAAMVRRGGGGAPQAGCRGLGPALLACLDYLKVLQGQPFLPASAGGGGGPGGGGVVSEHLPANPSPVKMLVFLSGPPDLGSGRLLNPNRRRQPSLHRHHPHYLPPHAQQPQHGPAAPLPTHPSPPSAQPQADPTVPAAAPPPPPPPPTPHALPDPAGLDGGMDPDPDAWMTEVPAASREFWEQASVACASLGVCVDLFGVSGQGLGLRTLQPLCNSTGGGIYLYPSLDESAMPQDVYLRLSSPSATSGILRMRTSPQFKVVRHYGRLFADAALPDLHHIISADASDVFAVDFDFTGPQGFTAVAQGGAGAASLPPTLQVAFQFTTLFVQRVPGAAPDKEGSSSSGQLQPTEVAAPSPSAASAAAGRQYWLQRRLRVATYRVMPAASVREVHTYAHADAVVTLLMHKIMRAAGVQGLNEARLLLRDWLVILALSYHRSVHAHLTREQLATVPVDLMFSQSPPLAPLPRLIYALLRSPLLAPAAEGQHPDLTPFLAHLWSVLPPGELVRAVYPLMSSYASAEQQAFPRHSLSRAALSGPDAPPIFLLDAYILILVYYTQRCPPGTPYPPPQQSALRKAVAAIRAERRITPQVKILREGEEDAELFEQLLLDEPDGGSSGGAEQGQQQQSSGFGLVQFLAHVQSEAGLQLQHEINRPQTS